MRKLFCTLVCVLVMAAAAVTVFAARSVEMTLEAAKATVSPGDTVSVAVQMSALEDCTSAGISLSLDEGTFEFVSGSCSVSGTVISNFSNGIGVFAFNGGTAVSGEIFTFQLKVKDGAVPGEYSVSAKGSARNPDGAIPVTVNALVITVLGSGTKEPVQAPDEQTTAATEQATTAPAVDETQPTEEKVPADLVETAPADVDDTVQTEETKPTQSGAPAPASFPWWLLVVGAVIIAGIATAFVLKKRNNG